METKEREPVVKPKPPKRKRTKKVKQEDNLKKLVIEQGLFVLTFD